MPNGGPKKGKGRHRPHADAGALDDAYFILDKATDQRSRRLTGSISRQFFRSTSTQSRLSPQALC